MRHALLVLILTMAVGCAAQRTALDYQRDSVVLMIKDTTVIHDTLIMVQVPEGQDKSVLPETDTSRLCTSVAKSEAYVKDGKLHHTLTNRGDALIPIRLELPKYIHQERHYMMHGRKVKEIVEVEKALSRWQRFLMTVGWVAMGVAALWLGRMVMRLVR